ncbi:hypothetical protein NW762_014623 [Fusarium torreyae]|uniref:Uncharacterized protein n=1 Tax=Fusarium torreyae TaxID=1237075 RepID=A0A9W8RLV5_9HYPO|nr:hypothetical protein NW762_014623 [Fusarium torreyae]
MSIPQYQSDGLVDTTTPLDLKSLAGKSVIMTGGASGLGKAYTEAFVKAGAYVTIADYNEQAGQETNAEFSGIAAYADQPGSPQYNASKWGVRGLMRNLRRTAFNENIRVALVAPWYVKTPILSSRIIDYLVGKGVKFATVEDCCNAMLRIASDKTINGRAFGVVPREESPSGYMDLDHDDYVSGDFMKGWEEIVLDTAQSITDLA